MDTKLIIDIQKVSVNKRLLDFSEKVYSGEQIHLLGANGAGKSTLLAALSGFLITDGKILINNTDIKKYDLKSLGKIRAYLPQTINHFPILKVFQYLDLFLFSSHQYVEIFDKLCCDFQLSPLLQKPIGQLSGGESQRVRIAATFLQVWQDDPLYGKFILLDEPTNNLDIIQQAILDKWVKSFCDRGGTVIMSGHNLSHSYKNANRIWMFKQGKLVSAGNPDEIMSEANLSDVFMTEIKLSHNSTNKIWQVINFDG